MKVISSEIEIDEITNIAPSIRNIGDIAFQDINGNIYHMKTSDIIKLSNYCTTLNANNLNTNNVENEQPVDLNSYFK